MVKEKTINQLAELGTSDKVVDKPLHDEKGNLTLEGIMVLRAALNNPANHFVVDLGINKFKKMVRLIPGFTKSMINDQIRRYKLKGWGEYTELVNHKGSFPVHNPLYCGV